MKKKESNGEEVHAAHQAVRAQAQNRKEAETKWREVNKVTDDFADAFERAIRRMQ